MYQLNKFLWEFQLSNRDWLSQDESLVKIDLSGDIDSCIRKLVDESGFDPDTMLRLVAEFEDEDQEDDDYRYDYRIIGYFYNGECYEGATPRILEYQFEEIEKSFQNGSEDEQLSD